MVLKTMKRTDLDLYLKGLVKKERDILHQIIQAIYEIDSRRMYLEMGYASLFDYLTQAVGYSNASAQRRIDAAKLLREIPQLNEKIQSGELKLNQISLVQKAAREVAKTRHIKVTSEEKKTLLESLAHQTVQQTQKEIASFFDLPVVQLTKQRVQADDSVRIELTLSKSSYEKLQRAQALISGAVPDRDLVCFIEYVSDKIIQQRSSVKFSLTTSMGLEEKKLDAARAKKQPAKENGKTLNPRKANPQAQNKTVQYKDKSLQMSFRPQTENKTAALPAKTFALPMWKRGPHARQNGCQYKDPVTGKVCGSHFFLQVDHIQPRWAKGSNTPENLQVLCAGHNRLKYRKETGMEYLSP